MPQYKGSTELNKSNTTAQKKRGREDGDKRGGGARDCGVVYSSKRGIARSRAHSFICSRFSGASVISLKREEPREKEMVYGDDHNIRSTGENKNGEKEGGERTNKKPEKKREQSEEYSRRNNESRKCASTHRPGR